jgi:hypothetical protein
MVEGRADMIEMKVRTFQLLLDVIWWLFFALAFGGSCSGGTGARDGERWLR